MSGCWWQSWWHPAQNPQANPDNKPSPDNKQYPGPPPNQYRNPYPNQYPYPNPYPARPAGANGTQQFAKMTDDQLFQIVFSYANQGFWKKYYNKSNVKASTRDLISHLKEIINEAATILLNIQKQYGYTPDETASAVKRCIWKANQPSKNPAFRMFMVVFGIASIMIEVNGAPTPEYTKPAPRKAPPQQRQPSKPTQGPTAQGSSQTPVFFFHRSTAYSDNTQRFADVLAKLKEYKKHFKRAREQASRDYEDCKDDDDDCDDEGDEEDDDDGTPFGLLLGRR